VPDDDVELAELVIDAFNRRDWDTWHAHWHADGDWFDPPEAPGSGVHHGVEAIRGYFDELLEIGEGWTVQVQSVERLSPGRVLVAARSRLVARGSGIAMEDELFQVVDSDGGRVRRVRNFRTPEQARAAAAEL
jgi:ketosteroid isomerase-like protein